MNLHVQEPGSADAGIPLIVWRACMCVRPPLPPQEFRRVIEFEQLRNNWGHELNSTSSFNNILQKVGGHCTARVFLHLGGARLRVPCHAGGARGYERVLARHVVRIL
jgi:hypothetical protein